MRSHQFNASRMMASGFLGGIYSMKILRMIQTGIGVEPGGAQFEGGGNGSCEVVAGDFFLASIRAINPANGCAEARFFSTSTMLGSVSTRTTMALL